ncbi:MAG: HAMP domain-containing sensor histidine kinase [Bacteroidota bacterium]
MIIGSIILSTKESILQTSFALLLVGGMTFLEYIGILQHYPLTGFITSDMYRNLTYILCTGFIFITTSYLVVYLIRTIILESKRHEIAYLQANIKLRQKDKIKSEYVLRITHDIKGHIIAIQSCISILSKQIAGPLNPQQLDFVNRANNRIILLNKFISNLLSITQRKLQQKSEKKLFNLINSLDEILKLLEISAQEKNIRIHKNIESTISELYGERSAIEEVLMNLISNSIKYSSLGKNIYINIKDKQDSVLIEVIDNGLGIPEEELHLIFNEFYRASNVKTQVKDGTGLGLAISKQIIDNHGGKIWVDSKLNLGTTFSLLLKKNG